jgi:hypothetical protein
MARNSFSFLIRFSTVVTKANVKNINGSPQLYPPIIRLENNDERINANKETEKGLK